MESLLSLLGSSWPLLIFLAFFVALVWRPGSRTLPGPRPPPGSLSGPEQTGSQTWQGHTQGIDWQAEVTWQPAEVDDGQANRRRTNAQSTRWSAPGLRPASGALLLMSLPDDCPPAAARGADSVLGAMAAPIARAAHKAFLHLAFGAERTAPLRLGPEHHVPLERDEFGCAFAAFADPPDLMGHLSPAARALLLKGHHGRPALLWDEEGLTLAWPHARVGPAQQQELAALVAYGASVVGLLTASRGGRLST
ncbi:hypothetical protein [Inhella gelatinilytica]|uniref:Uncharacterized protein n=1 Tax=Inhella gelatinilytica TaxID=2795030 RepID=A0A931IW62_9BURK|nr:hypothetical protein [Inhella gelatinilytica]MBH9552134.1 hypothetical protein [Inhella gelatinilytica]